MKPGPKPAHIPESMGELMGRMARIHVDSTERMRMMAEALYWIIGHSDLTGEINRRAREALATNHFPPQEQGR